MKVFRFLLAKKSGKFQEYKDKRNAHFLYLYALLAHSVPTPILYKCGVLFICSRATPNAYYQINERLHTFYFIYLVTQEPSGK